MINPLYKEMVGHDNNPIQMLNQLRSNPTQFILQRGFHIPDNIGNNPSSIIQYLLNSGQVSQERYNQAVQMTQNFNQFM